MTKYIATRAHDFTDFNKMVHDGTVIDMTAEEASTFNAIAGGMFVEYDKYIREAKEKAKKELEEKGLKSEILADGRAEDEQAYVGGVAQNGATISTSGTPGFVAGEPPVAPANGMTTKDFPGASQK